MRITKVSIDGDLYEKSLDKIIACCAVMRGES